MTGVVLAAVVCLAYANGANDNFKGVATLFGSGTTNYRRALAWGTVTTFLGSLTAVVLAGTLLRNFSGRGLVDDTLVRNVDYAGAIALGSGLTVLLATRFGLPISTTHGLVGALVGAGWAAGSAINLQKLGGTFFLPLLVSPVAALAATVIGYPLLHGLRLRLGIGDESCVCVGTTSAAPVPAAVGGTKAALGAAEQAQVSIQTGTAAECRQRYAGRMLGVEAHTVLDGLHYLSAGAVSFARGLNDTPKIAALLLIAPGFVAAGPGAGTAAGGGLTGLLVVGLAMAAGGAWSARRVAETMSRKITPMNHGQGLTANVVTSLIVIGASRAGLPVSTTHVNCGALFGIGTATGGAQWSMIGRILAAWFTTLPLSAALGAACYAVLSRVGS